MKRSIRKISVIAGATLLMSAGINGLAFAADTTETDKEMPLVPPMMQRLIKDIDLTDTQIKELKSIREKQKALKSEFWDVFTEDQKDMLLEKLSHRQKSMRDHLKNKKGKKHDRWQDNEDSGE